MKPQLTLSPLNQTSVSYTTRLAHIAAIRYQQAQETSRAIKIAGAIASLLLLGSIA